MRPTISIRGQTRFTSVKPGNEPKQIQSEKLVKQVGAVYKATENISLVGRYAEGFKMPTSQQLYTSLPNGAGVNQDLVPNPRLRPEQVKSYEAGIRGQFSRGYFTATVFKADYTDFIQNFVPVPSVNFPGLDDLTYQNLSSVKLWGVELAGEFRFHENWTASASLAYTEGKQKFDATSPVVAFDGTTPFSGVFGLRYSDRPNGFDAQLISTWASDVLSRSSPLLYRPDGYIVFDAIVGWSPQAVPGLTLRGSILNLADTRYFASLNGTTTYNTVPTTAVAISNPLELRTAPGRTFKVGANYAF